MKAGVGEVRPSLSSKKRYAKPSLQVYGTLESVTRNNKATATSGDNPTKRNHKTGG
jgi:hypothetical protein